MKKTIMFIGMIVFTSFIFVIGNMTIKGSDESGSAISSNETPKEIQKQKEERTNKPMVALTFDDGPHAIYTKELLGLLDQYNAKATFFMVGSNMEQNPELVKEVAMKGHEIGNHTYSHKDLMTLNQADRRTEIHRVQELTYSQIGSTPRWLRPPYGSGDVAVLESETNMDIAFWDVDTRDWESRDPSSIYQMFEQNIKDGDIVLFHDIYATSIEAVEQILKTYSSKYRFVTLSTLYDATTK